MCIKVMRLKSKTGAVLECQHEEFMLKPFSKGERLKFSVEGGVVIRGVLQEEQLGFRM